jgi:FAD/FMN-containing dehydrogenase
MSAAAPRTPCRPGSAAQRPGEAAGEARATLAEQLRERRNGRAIGQAVERLRQALDTHWRAVRALADRLRQTGRSVLQDGGCG